MEIYGLELVLDLHNCNPLTFTRESITNYFRELCVLINMKGCDLHFWDDVGVPEGEKQTNPKTKGTSAIQFIITSNITIHTLDILEKVFINIFSCKRFDSIAASEFSAKWFAGTVKQSFVVRRY